MIQELLSMVEGRKVSIPGGLHPDYTYPSSYLASPTSVSPSPPPPSSASSEPQQNLKCPRCDSTNTKFCYYNNYNLTQPRHFCKTCRRYWTKGGALRNIPIGGGCRKARPALPSGRPGGGVRVKPASNDVAARLDGRYEQPSSQMLWNTPYSSHLLALLRGNQLQNPNPSPIQSLNFNSMKIKDEGAMKEQCLHFDNLGQLSAGEPTLWRNCTGQYQYHQQQQQQLNLQHQPQNDMFMGEEKSQESLQTLRSPVNNNGDRSRMLISSACSAASRPSTFMGVSSTAASILEPLPPSGGDLGYWNQGLSMTELSSTNGAYH